MARHLLEGSLANQCSVSEPRGCLGVISSVACGPEAESIRAEVLERGRKGNQALIERMKRASQEGDLPAHVDPEGLTKYLTAILQGMAVQAGAGASREDLQRLVDTTMAIWPSA